MQYKTVYKGSLLLIKEANSDSNLTETGTYIIWQCNLDWKPIVGWSGYLNAMQALKDFKLNSKA